MATQRQPNQRELRVERVSGDDVFEVKERGGVVKSSDVEIQQELVQEATVVPLSQETEERKPAQRTKQRERGQELGY